MPGPTATAGVVGVLCLSATDRTTATTARSAGGGFVPGFKTPLRSPLVQGGTPFSSLEVPRLLTSTTYLPFLYVANQVIESAPGLRP